MITSVTSATVAATAAVAGWAAALGAGGALLVIGLLVTLEITGESDRGWERSFRRALKVAAAPLVLVFALGVIARAFAVLG